MNICKTCGCNKSVSDLDNNCQDCGGQNFIVIDGLKSMVMHEILADGPITAKEIHKYLLSQNIKCAMHEVAVQLNALIKDEIIKISDEGNTFVLGDLLLNFIN